MLKFDAKLINFRQLNKIIYIKKQRHIFVQNFVYEYTTRNLSARNQGHYL